MFLETQSTLIRTVEYYNSNPVILDNLGKNIERYWKQNSNSISTNAGQIANGLFNALKSHYSGFDFAVVVWKDHEHGSYHRFIAGSAAFVRTRDFNADAKDKWVIMGIVSKKLDPQTNANLKSQVDNILEPPFWTADRLAKTSKPALEVIDELIGSASWKRNSPTGVVITWRPSDHEIAIASDARTPFAGATPREGECLYNKSQWCHFNGRMYHIKSPNYHIIYYL